jgi:hypothetical protein
MVVRWNVQILKAFVRILIGFLLLLPELHRRVIQSASAADPPKYMINKQIIRTPVVLQSELFISHGPSVAGQRFGGATATRCAA